MRIWMLLAAIVACGAALAAGAGASDSLDEGATTSQVRWEDFDDPGFDPASPPARPSTAFSGRRHVVGLGAEVIDSKGQRGRIHTVVQGDTLWDISEAYLGTPWVWPSVWRENEDIANPHRIVPEDRIWISSTEMRRLTDSEADALLANRISEVPIPSEEIVAAPVVEGDDPLASLTPQAPETGSLSLAAKRASRSTETGLQLRLPWRENFGFVSGESLQAASSIVGSPSNRTWLAGNDTVYLGLGEGEVEVGGEFTIFRDAEEIRDQKTDRLIGYHVDVLGWVRVVEVDGEAAIADVTSSNAEIRRGDLVVPRMVRPTVVAVKRGHQSTLGQIVHLPASRTVMGMGDYVYIDRGAHHGLEIGSELEVFDSGFNVRERVRRETVHTPDEVVAMLVVVGTQPTSSVAYVAHSVRELQVGDAFRTALMNDSLASLR